MQATNRSSYLVFAHFVFTEGRKEREGESEGEKGGMKGREGEGLRETTKKHQKTSESKI